MSIIQKLFPNVSPIATVYPILILVLVPTLLIINTLWNLRSFNRDANFIVRHQAVAVATSIKPIISQGQDINLAGLFNEIKSSNEDILSLTYVTKTSESVDVVASTEKNPDLNKNNPELMRLSDSFKEPIAGLSYDTVLGKNVWNVVVPLRDGGEFLLVKLDIKSVSEILTRTSNDSLILLVVLIIVTLIILANHFYFYVRSLKTMQLEELDKLKDQFVSMAAHELKAPITAIISYLFIIHKKLSDQESQKISKELSVLDKVANELNKLVADLLDVSRISQGRMEIKKQTVQINDIIDNVIATMMPNINEKNLSLVYSPIELPTIQSDPDRIRQILTNLVSNAVKYTLAGNITIETKVVEKTIHVTVKDSGIGIPAEELPKLFTKFHRVGDKQTEDVRGTGLGLWITKQVIELLGGKIYAESIYGTGTNIIFTLPL